MRADAVECFDLALLERRATPATFERGKALSSREDIAWRVFLARNGTFRAEAWFPAPNRAPFHTRVSWDGHSLRTRCSCPVRRGHYCSHRVAVALRLRLHLDPSGGANAGDHTMADSCGAHSDLRFTLRAHKRLDWFDFSLAIHLDEEEIPTRVLLNAWRHRRRFCRAPSGRFVRVPTSWFDAHGEDIEALLGPRRATKSGSPDSSLTVIAANLSRSVDVVDADQAFEQVRQHLRDLERPEPAASPKGLQATLRPYQLQGYGWLLALRDTGFHGILADDMGLGKTLQVLALLVAEKEAGRPGPSLIVAPTSVVYNWLMEAARFAPSLEVVAFHGRRRKLDPRVRDADVLVTSFALLRRDLAFHRSQRYHYLVLDEAQVIKNPDSDTARACRRIPARHRLALTGTPIENRLLDLWSLFAFLMPALLGSRQHFQKRFVAPVERNGDETRRDQLRSRTAPFILRRVKEEVIPELPSLTETTLYCEFPPDQAHLYARAATTFRRHVKRELASRGMGATRFALLEALLKLRLICCHPPLSGLDPDSTVTGSAKLDLFQDLTDQLVQEGHRVLVFSQFVRMLTVLKRSLEARGIPYAYLDGRTRDRQTIVDDFNRSDTPVFLVSLKAGGTGLNLTGADYVIHYDPWWNPAVETQATDRAHRIGQTRPVHAYRLIARGTVEEKILRLHERKQDLADGVIPPTSSILSALTPQDIDTLLRPVEPTIDTHR